MLAAAWRWPPRTRPRCCWTEHEDAALALFNADGSALDELARLADDLRRDVIGDDVTYVVNRNINFSNVCYVGCRFCAFAQRGTDADAYRLSVDQVADRAEEAWPPAPPRSACRAASTRSCRSPRTPTWCARSRRRVPGMHVHAFSPMEIVTARAKAGVSVRDWLTGCARPASTRSPARPPRSSTTTSAGC